MSAPVLLIKFSRILLFLRNEFNKSNAEARILDSIYHMTFK